jgi:uncharacterized cupin superfamily protein
MGYRVIDPESLAGTGEFPCDRRSLADAADLSVLAAAVYTLAPGEQLSRSYHYHEQREELFFVLAGTLTVETPEGAYEVPSGSAFVAERNSPIRPHNPQGAKEAVRVLGVGAPQFDPGVEFDPDRDEHPADPE